MKKLLVVLVLAIVMSVPELSFAESQEPLLTEQHTKETEEEFKLAARLLRCVKDINALRGDVLAAIDGIANRADRQVLLQISNSLDSASTVCFYLRELQYATVNLNAAAKHRYYALGGIKCLQYSKRRVQDDLDGINKLYGHLKSPAVLRLAGEAKDKLRSVLALIDEIITKRLYSPAFRFNR